MSAHDWKKVFVLVGMAQLTFWSDLEARPGAGIIEAVGEVPDPDNFVVGYPERCRDFQFHAKPLFTGLSWFGEDVFEADIAEQEASDGAGSDAIGIMVAEEKVVQIDVRPSPYRRPVDAVFLGEDEPGVKVGLIWEQKDLGCLLFQERRRLASVLQPNRDAYLLNARFVPCDRRSFEPVNTDICPNLSLADLPCCGDGVPRGDSGFTRISQGAPEHDDSDGGQTGHDPRRSYYRAGGLGHTLLGGEITPGKLARLPLGACVAFLGFFVSGRGWDRSVASERGYRYRLIGASAGFLGLSVAIEGVGLALSFPPFLFWTLPF